MKLPSLPIGELGKSFGLVLKEYGKTRKFEYSRTVDCIVVNENNIGDYHKGLTDESYSMLILPLLQRIYADEKGLNAIHMRTGQTLFILSENYHGTINVAEHGKITESLVHDSQIKFKLNEKLQKYLSTYFQFHDDIMSFEVKNIPNPINIHLKDNKISLNLTAIIYRVMQAKSLQWLDEPTRWRYILSCALTGVLGILIGLTGGVIGMMIFYNFTR